MLLTVITVVRNHRHGLARTIASLKSQTWQRFEYVVIDGASDDGTTDVIGANLDVIDHWRSEADQGIYDAMNKGLRSAGGELILFLNAGDELSADDSLELALRAAELHADADVLYFEAIRGDGSRAGRFHRRSAILFDSVGNHQAILFRNRVHQRFHFDTRYRIKADRDVQLRMFQAGHQMVNLPHVIARTEPGGVSSTNVARKEQENLLICLRNGVALRWTMIALFLCVTRITFYGMGRCFGIDWDTTKSMGKRLRRLFRGRARPEVGDVDVRSLPRAQC